MQEPFEGKRDKATAILLHLGKRRFGTPYAAVQAAIDNLDRIELLKRLLAHILEVERWDDLLKTL